MDPGPNAQFLHAQIYDNNGRCVIYSRNTDNWMNNTVCWAKTRKNCAYRPLFLTSVRSFFYFIFLRTFSVAMRLTPFRELVMRLTSFWELVLRLTPLWELVMRLASFPESVPPDLRLSDLECDLHHLCEGVLTFFCCRVFFRIVE